jgi:hypothetical protein
MGWHEKYDPQKENLLNLTSPIFKIFALRNILLRRKKDCEKNYIQCLRKIFSIKNIHGMPKIHPFLKEQAIQLKNIKNV